MEDKKNPSSLKFTITFLYWIGIWPDENGKENRKSVLFFREHFIRIFTISIVIQNILQLIGIYASIMNEDFSSILVCLMGLIFFNICWIIMYSLYKNRFLLHETIEVVENLTETVEESEENSETIAEAKKLSVLISHTIPIAAFYSTVVSMTLSYVVARIKSKIMFSVWFETLPVQLQKSLLFEIVFIFDCQSALASTMILIVSGMLFCSLNILMTAQFKVLGYNLENLLPLLEKANGFTMKELQFRLMKNIENENQEENSFDTEFKCDAHENFIDIPETTELNGSSAAEQENAILHVEYLVPEERFNNAAHTNTNASCQEEVIALQNGMQMFLKVCAVHQSTLIKLSENINTIFKNLLNIQMMLNVLQGMFGLYVTTVARELNDQVVSVIAGMSVILLEFYFFCKFGANLATESFNVLDAAYACDWFNASESFKRSLRIIMSRSQRPTHIYAAGIPLSMATFKTGPPYLEQVTRLESLDGKESGQWGDNFFSRGGH